MNGMVKNSRSLIPKQLAHSSRAMYLSWSASHCSKKLGVQCSIGMRGARRGASSVRDRKLMEHKNTCTFKSITFWTASGTITLNWTIKVISTIKHFSEICLLWNELNIPINRVLVKLAKLPVNGEDVHVVVLFKVQGQEVQRMFTSLQPLLILVNLLHLQSQHEVCRQFRGFAIWIWLYCSIIHAVFFFFLPQDKAATELVFNSNFVYIVMEQWKVLEAKKKYFATQAHWKNVPVAAFL